METEDQPSPTAGTLSSDPTRAAVPTHRLPGSSISGKKLTIGVLVGLVVTGGIVAYVLWSYTQLDIARAQTAKAWRVVSEPLSTRYRSIELAVAKRVDAGSLSMAWAEKFRLAVDRYRTTAQTELQYETALELEQLLAESELDAAATAPPSPELISAVEQLNAHLQRQQQVLDSLGCRVLDIFLSFVEPQPLMLSSASV